MLKVVLILFINFIYSSDFSENISNEQTFFSNSMDNLKVLQNDDVDEYARQFYLLEKEFKQRDDDFQLVELYQNHSSYLLRVNQFDSLFSLLHQTRGMIKVSDKEGLLDNYFRLATGFFYQGTYDSLVYWEKKATELISPSSPLYGHYLLVSSYKSSFDGSYVEAIEKTLNALEFFEKSNDLPNLGIALVNLASDYDKLGDYQKQRESLIRAIEIQKEIDYPLDLILSYNNLGSSYKESRLFDKALAYFDSAFIELSKINSPRLLAQNLTNRGSIFEAMGNYDEAETLFLKCKEICVENQIGYGILLSDLNLGDLYRVKGQFSQADNHLNDALTMSLEMKMIRETALAYERLAWLNRDRGAFKQAYEFLDSYYTLNDSLVNESVRNTANELMEKFESEKKEKEIITLSKNKLNQQFIIALMGLALVSLLFLVQWWRNKQRITKLELIDAEKLHQVKAEALKQREKDLLEETMEKVVLKEQIKDLVKKVTEDGDYTNIGNQLRRIESKQNPWNDMIEKFKLLNPQFVDELLKNHPELNQNDLEFCSLIKMNLTTKEIAQILRITDQSVRTRKYRILKKIGLSKETDLNSWIMSLNEQS